MAEVVSAEWLAKKIDSELGFPFREGRGFWTSVERRRKPSSGESNWRYSFNPGAVPPGFEKHWQAIRTKFEERYALEEE
jgi:hypothetical protein